MKEHHGFPLQQAPRSAGHHAGIHPDDTNSFSRDPYADAERSHDIYSVRMPNSCRRYDQRNGSKALIPAGVHPGQVFMGADGVQYVVMPGKRPMPARASAINATTEPVATPVPKQSKGKGKVYAVGGVVTTLLILWLGIAFLNWWTNLQQDWTYTHDFRTFSVDQAVGHNGDSPDHPSHFIIQNDKGQILIIELPADDPKKAVIIPAATLIGADREPVTVTFKDTTGSGHLDLILHFQGQQMVFLNTGEKFVPKNS